MSTCIQADVLGLNFCESATGLALGYFADRNRFLKMSFWLLHISILFLTSEYDIIYENPFRA
jgi:hypothetical protein